MTGNQDLRGHHPPMRDGSITSRAASTYPSTGLLSLSAISRVSTPQLRQEGPVWKLDGRNQSRCRDLGDEAAPQSVPLVGRPLVGVLELVSVEPVALTSECDVRFPRAG